MTIEKNKPPQEGYKSYYCKALCLWLATLDKQRCNFNTCDKEILIMWCESDIS